MPGKRIRIILHAKVAMDEAVRTAVKRLREEGHDIEVRVTWEPSDTEKFAREAVLSHEIDVLVAGGGDGTLNAVVTAVLKTDSDKITTLGLLPLGTANDFARGVGIPLDDVYAALRIVVDEKAVPIDVGQCNDRYFINLATGGFGTQVTLNTPDELKKALGGTAYLLTGLSQPQMVTAIDAKFSSPDFEWQGRFLAMAVGNGRYAGGGVDLCPYARVNDGLLDVTIAPDMPESSIPEALADLLQNGFESIQRHGITARVSTLRIDAPTGIQVNLDGEPLEDTCVEFGVTPGAVNFHLPRNSGLVADAD